MTTTSQWYLIFFLNRSRKLSYWKSIQGWSVSESRLFLSIGRCLFWMVLKVFGQNLHTLFTVCEWRGEWRGRHPGRHLESLSIPVEGCLFPHPPRALCFQTSLIAVHLLLLQPNSLQSAGVTVFRFLFCLNKTSQNNTKIFWWINL